MSDVITQLARAILYEGYLLYPYRFSSLKNRQRWNFGVLFPPAFSVDEASTMQAECLVQGTVDSVIEVHIQFLQCHAEGTVERTVATGEHSMAMILEKGLATAFSFPNLIGSVDLSLARVQPDAFRLTVRIHNQTPFEGKEREKALQHSFISTQALLRVRHGAFCSMTDPPPSLATAKDQCRNIGTWPVLVGSAPRRDCMLCAPIILPDYPSVAPQSPTDLFDNTEIDEILTLRIQTLSDDEKLELRSCDQRASHVLEQAESIATEKLRNLHGAVYRRLEPGDRVRLKPNRRADIFDLALAGRTATVCSVENDFENNAYACVTIDDDPGKDFGVEGKPGHRFFFFLDELERLT